MSTRIYLHNCILALRTNAEYRFNFLVSNLTPFITLFVNLTVWQVVTYGGRTVAGFTMDDLVQYYVWVTFISFFFSNIFWDLSNEIKSGDVSGLVMKPISVYWWYYCRNSGRSLARFALIFVGMVAFYYFCYGQMSWNFVAFVVSILLARQIYFTIDYIIGLLAFWTREVHGFQHGFRWTMRILSGELFPLALFGATAVTVLKYLPFQAMFTTPILMLEASWVDAVKLMSVQIIWVAVFGFAAYIIFKRGLLRLESVGR